MPRFMIERYMPGVGLLTQEQLTAISQRSCSILRSMGPEIQWVQSYVTADKVYCIYIAPNAETIRRHAAAGGFPVDVISPIHSMIDPLAEEGMDGYFASA